MAYINYHHIELSFANHIVFSDLSLSIQKGEIVTFFGPSGCGKSSLIKLLLNIHQTQRGEILIDRQKVRDYIKPIAYTPQDNELLPWLSVYENIKLWAKETGNTSFSIDDILALVDMIQHKDKLPAVLSGGMARRTALARTLATESDIFCFDEAMVGIEKNLRHKLLVEIRKYLKNHNKTAIFISHDFEETIFLSDRIFLFSPPPTIISKEIVVNESSETSEKEPPLIIEFEADLKNIKYYDPLIQRDESFIYSQKFNEIYNQMLTKHD